MKIKNVLIDERENVITVGDLVRNSAGDNAPKSYRVVYNSPPIPSKQPATVTRY